MRIATRIYDATKAVHVGKWDNCPSASADTIIEDLYRKRRGEYFLVGGGGENTKYKGTWGNITPLTEDQAREWARDKLPADKYNLFFPPTGDDADLVQLGFRIPRREAERLRSYATRAGTTQATLLRAWINSLPDE